MTDAMRMFLYEWGLWIGIFGLIVVALGELRTVRLFKRVERGTAVIFLCSLIALFVAAFAQAGRGG